MLIVIVYLGLVMITVEPLRIRVFQLVVMFLEEEIMKPHEVIGLLPYRYENREMNDLLDEVVSLEAEIKDFAEGSIFD